LKLSKTATTIYTDLFQHLSNIKEERKSGLSGTDRYADLQGYNNAAGITPQKGRCSCQISHTIEIAGLHSKAVRKISLLCHSCHSACQERKFKTLFLVLDTEQIHLLKCVKCMKGWTLLQKIGTNLCTGDGISKADNRAGYEIISLLNGYGSETLYGHLSKYNSKAGPKKSKTGRHNRLCGSWGDLKALIYIMKYTKTVKVVNPLNF
jgi:hypothetical protein